MQITFENDIGKITMGGNSSYKWRIITIEGIGLPEKDPNTVTYAGQDGQKTLSVVSNARTITIAGDLKNDGQTMQEFAKAMRIFNKEVTVKLREGAKQRKITCQNNKFDPGEKNGAARLFTLQLTADNPFFQDFVNKIIAVFKRTNNVTIPFTFPTDGSGIVFTTRDNEVDVNNMGDVKTQPIFYIYNLSGGTGSASNVGIEIENTTTNQAITLKYSTCADEIITIDIPRRKITSNKNGNLINYISDNTYLSDFWFDTGLNHIVVINGNTGEEISVTCEYSNQYVEAIN